MKSFGKQTYMTGSSSGLGRRRLTLDEYVAGVLGRDRGTLARAITLVESSRHDDQELAQALLERLLPLTGQSIRVGITGLPGAGKSTLIERLGCRLTAEGRRVAVLAVDPSSPVSGGSLLADKTRMVRLHADTNAFIRPSPSGQTVGGVARKTREALFLCEAAGYNVVLIETVGAGQADTAVAEMTDFFLVLLITGAGDEVQVMKRGLLELADLITVNKADGDNLTRARSDAALVQQMVNLLRGPTQDDGRTVPVTTCSALEGTGDDVIWQVILDRHQRLQQDGRLDHRRRAQAVRWMWSLVEERVNNWVHSSPVARTAAEHAALDVRSGTITAVHGAELILTAIGLPRGYMSASES